MPLGVVAIIGSPNVGKSTIFNRIIGTRRSIIDDEPGVTRDRLYADATWLTKEFRVIDTGGIEIANRPFQEQIRAQAEMAIDEADVIVYIVDGQVGVTNDDQEIAKMLYKSNKPIILAVNKIDDISKIADIYEFSTLGLGEPIAISGAHSIGVGDLLDLIVKLLPESEPEKREENEIVFSIIGRPNVGKSSFINAVLNEERVIVTDVPGTTRDAISIPFERASFGPCSCTGRPSSRIVPSDGLKLPAMIFTRVVLPAPLSPTNPTTSPALSVSEMSVSAVIAP